MTIPVSVLVQTKNEATGIAACLAALADFAEVIVVDSSSTDNTQSIARDHGATVINFDWNGRYPKKKQWQLDHIRHRHRWVLFLDADEVPTSNFIRDLPALLRAADKANVVAFDLQLQYKFDGRTLRYGHRVTKRALLRPDRVRFPTVDDLAAPGMGELEGHYQPVAAGKTRTIANAILHDDKDLVRTWFDRHNRYSDWEVYLRTHPAARRGVGRLRSRQGQLFDRVPGKPVAFFLFAFFMRQGFRDRQPGFNYAMALAFYYWQIGLKYREAKRRETHETP